MPDYFKKCGNRDDMEGLCETQNQRYSGSDGLFPV